MIAQVVKFLPFLPLVVFGLVQVYAAVEICKARESVQDFENSSPNKMLCAFIDVFMYGILFLACMIFLVGYALFLTNS